MNAKPRPKGREAIKAWNHQKIIDATIGIITEHGIAGTTVAKVVQRAGVSMGMINVHFKSKEALLQEVLEYMAADHKEHWLSVLEAAGDGAAERIMAFIFADFHDRVLNLSTMGVWFAFRAQARAKPEYIDLVGTRESELMQESIRMFRQLNEEGPYSHPAGLVSRGLIAMQEGMWTDFYLYPDQFDRSKALQTILTFLSSLYPNHFSVEMSESLMDRLV